MSRWPKWVGDSLTPGELELEALQGFAKPPLRDAVVEATEPTDDELARVLKKRPWQATQRAPQRSAWLLAGGGLTAAAAAVWLAVGSSYGGYGAVTVALNEPLALAADGLVLGPSIHVTGEATVELSQAGEGGTELVLTEGLGHFEVDPTGAWRDLSVVADDVLVQVHGTIFDVEHRDEYVGVRVERGVVSVTWEGERLLLTAGQSWERPMGEPVAALGLARPEAEPTPQDVVVDAEPLVPVEPVVLERDAVAPAQQPVAPVAVQREEAPTQARVPVATPSVDVRPISPQPLSADRELTRLLTLQASGVSAVELLAQADSALERHGDSAVSDDLQRVRFAALAQVDPAGAVEEMSLWLQEHPTSAREPLVRFERARALHRGLDRCDRALPDYRTLAQRQDDVGEGSTAGAGLCAAALGRRREAITWLDQALRRDLDRSLAAEVRAARDAL